jgi:hypothetical protein
VGVPLTWVQIGEGKCDKEAKKISFSSKKFQPFSLSKIIDPKTFINNFGFVKFFITSFG